MFSKMAMQHTRQAPRRDIHMHFSLASARSHTITASSKASATAATRNPPPHPDPYKTHASPNGLLSFLSLLGAFRLNVIKRNQANRVCTRGEYGAML